MLKRKFENNEIELSISPSSNLLWPYLIVGGKEKKIKALSASTLTEPLKLVEYEEKEIPLFILKKAAANGTIFHKTIQYFIEKKYENSDDLISSILEKVNTNNNIGVILRRKIKDSINFIKSEEKFNSENFLKSESLHYCLHDNVFFASYSDLEFENFTVEMKTNNLKTMKSPLSVLILQIQLFIQSICTGKDVYLFWATTEEVIFKKWEYDEQMFEIVDFLVEMARNKDIFKFRINDIVNGLLVNYFINGKVKKIFE